MGRMKELKAGDMVYITGTIYTARDAAHKRMSESLSRGENLPIELKNNLMSFRETFRDYTDCGRISYKRKNKRRITRYL